MTIRQVLGRGLMTAGMFLVYQLVTAVVLVPSLIGRPSTLLNAALFTAAFGGLIWFLAIVYTQWLAAEKSAHFGLRGMDFGKAKLLFLAVLAMVVIQAASVAMITLHWTPEAENQTELINFFNQAPLPMVLITVVGGPPVEEFVFRGLLMHSFPHQDQRAWRWLSGSVSALLFGLAHTGFDDPLNLAVYVALGAVFTAVYARTGDLRYSIGLHFLNNFAALFL
ncbi:CPBP family intramembrane glutamic endopeptidase [Lacticaseibacillus daqingensis]|uniref:CPBP family intramembrane glutamic endopeptidase n=1 Tax=Lacticaseibacillus daqingensis TaxID=2486014 RepID=UPI000F7951A3|nr:type II CAAX endopeptidase family protein [Lacticaseibacillus daqingensis]